MGDDFSEAVKSLLASRVGNLCSIPGCRALTIGPQDDPTKAVNVGVAAHITAASPGGPRYDPGLSPEERRAPSNGIWLCQNCAKLVKILKAICVYATIHVLHGMVNHLMRVITLKAIVGKQCIGIERSARFDMLSYFCLQCAPAAIRNHYGTDLPTKLFKRSALHRKPDAMEHEPS